METREPNILSKRQLSWQNVNCKKAGWSTLKMSYSSGDHFWVQDRKLGQILNFDYSLLINSLFTLKVCVTFYAFGWKRALVCCRDLHLDIILLYFLHFLHELWHWMNLDAAKSFQDWSSVMICQNIFSTLCLFLSLLLLSPWHLSLLLICIFFVIS